MSALSGKWKFVPYEYGPNWGENLTSWTCCLYGVKETEPAEGGGGSRFARRVDILSVFSFRVSDFGRTRSNNEQKPRGEANPRSRKGGETWGTPWWRSYGAAYFFRLSARKATVRFHASAASVARYPSLLLGFSKAWPASS